MSDYDAAVRQLAAEMPEAWTSDVRPKTAWSIVTSNAAHEVDAGVRQFAGDALPAARQALASSLPGGRTGARNIASTNSDFLRGDRAQIANGNFRNRTRGHDQNGEEDFYDPDMLPPENDASMPVRG